MVRRAPHCEERQGHGNLVEPSSCVAQNHARRDPFQSTLRGQAHAGYTDKASHSVCGMVSSLISHSPLIREWGNRISLSTPLRLLRFARNDNTGGQCVTNHTNEYAALNLLPVSATILSIWLLGGGITGVRKPGLHEAPVRGWNPFAGFEVK